MQNDIIFGIHHCVCLETSPTNRPQVKKAAENPKSDLEDSDFEIKAKEEYTLTRDGNEFQFKDYAPAVFHQVRSVLGVSPEEFLESWVIDDDSKMEESTARSGSMFYKTPDTKYLFKTILHPEVGAMVDLLKDYYEHLVNEPKSFIVKIYGLFRITYPNFLNSSQTWVLVMGNGFPPGIKMDQVFDLKGRTPKKGKGPTEREPISKGAMKDNEITRKILFYPYSKQVYIEQLEKDVALLKKHNIMDYSLLIGIHKLTPEEKAVIPLKLKGERKERKGKGKKKEDKATSKHFKKAVKNPHAKIFQYGGLIAKHPETGEDEIVFLGIIDNLTTFNVKKKVANACKRLLWDQDTLSTVRSEFYASRFLAWMTKTLLADEESADTRSEEVLFEEYVQKLRTFSQRGLEARTNSSSEKRTNSTDLPKKAVSDFGKKPSKLELPGTPPTKAKSARSHEEKPKEGSRSTSPSRAKSARGPAASRSPKSSRRTDTDAKTDSKGESKDTPKSSRKGLEKTDSKADSKGESKTELKATDSGAKSPKDKRRKDEEENKDKVSSAPSRSKSLKDKGSKAKETN